MRKIEKIANLLKIAGVKTHIDFDLELNERFPHRSTVNLSELYRKIELFAYVLENLDRYFPVRSRNIKLLLNYNTNYKGQPRGFRGAFNPNYRGEGPHIIIDMAHFANDKWDMNTSDFDFLTTVCHEFVHAEQVALGKLSEVATPSSVKTNKKYFASLWEDFDDVYADQRSGYSHEEYLAWPWEVEARRLASPIAQMVMVDYELETGKKLV